MRTNIVQFCEIRQQFYKKIKTYLQDEKISLITRWSIFELCVDNDLLDVTYVDSNSLLYKYLRKNKLYSIYEELPSEQNYLDFLSDLQYRNKDLSDDQINSIKKLILQQGYKSYNGNY